MNPRTDHLTDPVADSPARSPRLTDPARIAHARKMLADARSDAIDRLASLAAQLTGAPYAQVSMLTDEQVIAAIHGLELAPEDIVGPLEASLCTVTVAGDEPLVIDDTTADDRVSHLPPVVSGLVGSYLGVPVAPGGTPVGALCVYGPKERSWKPEDLALVRAVAEALSAELELSGIAADAVQTAVRLDLGFTAANIGSFDWNLRTDELHWDERLNELWGYDEDFVPHIDSWRQRIHPDDVPQVQAAVEAAVGGCGDYKTDYRIVLPDGTTRWISARGKVLCDVDGEPERMLGAAYDTTPSRVAGERLARLLETMSSAFFSVDPKWRVTYVNEQAERLLTRSREELLGQNIWEAYPDAVGTIFEERYRRAMRTGEPVSFESYYAPLDTWFEVRAWPSAEGLSVFFHDISERVAAEEQRNRAQQRLELLSVAGERLSSSLEVEDVLRVLGELVLPRFGEWVAVAVREDVAALLSGREAANDDGLRVARVAAQDPEVEQRLQSARGLVVGRGSGTAWERTTGEAVRQRLGAGPDDPPVITCALRSRGRTIGALVVGGRPGNADRALLRDVATRAAGALDNAVLFGAERRAGLALQRLLLPVELPQLPDVEIAARYLPGTKGRDVGGDFYIAHRLDDGRLVVAMGDVMGHGMPAAARMGQLRAVLTAYALDGEEPDRVLEHLARRVDDLLDVRMATILLSLYDPEQRCLTFASAGHPPPLIAPLDAAPRYVDLRPGPPIGIGPARYERFTADIPAGTTIVLYTDGLVERRSENVDRGMERLRDALEDLRLPPESVCDHVLRKLDRVRGGEDDVALLVFNHA